MNDINRGMKMMDLSDEDLERGMEIITRTKKYMSPEERKILIKVESLLDLVKGIKKLSSIDFDDYEETNFFRSMDEEDKKNMMIKEILEVFPEKRRESLDKAIDLKKKIDLFAELFYPDDFGDGGFSLSSLVNINNLGSMNNLKLLGSLLRTDDDKNMKNMIMMMKSMKSMKSMTMKNTMMNMMIMKMNTKKMMNKTTAIVNTQIKRVKKMGKNNKIALIVIQNYFKNIVFYYIIRI